MSPWPVLYRGPARWVLLGSPGPLSNFPSVDPHPAPWPQIPLFFVVFGVRHSLCPPPTWPHFSPMPPLPNPLPCALTNVTESFFVSRPFQVGTGKPPGDFPSRCAGRDQLLGRLQTPTCTLPGAGTVPGSCGQGGGCGREEVESPFSRAVSPASCPGALPQRYPASACSRVKLGPVPGAFREITDLTSPMLLDPQNTEHGRWGTGQPQNVQEEGAG